MIQTPTIFTPPSLARTHKRRRVEVDVESYQQFLKSSVMTDQQKHEFLTALWSIVVAFIDLGYCVHPTQRNLPDDVAMNEVHSLAESFLFSQKLQGTGVTHE